MTASIDRTMERGRWAERVTQVFLEQPNAHTRSMEEVAETLRTSERTLRRRLGEEGVRFPVLAERAMVCHAEGMLRDPSLSVKAIAWRLGYSDASAFTRALRRCTGRSPSVFRRARLMSADDPTLASP